MGRLRPISPMRELFPDALPKPSLGRTPELRWVRPALLLVDETYQRDLTKTSRNMIRRIVREFSWAKMKPPVVVEVERGYHCIDGQHTAIAAATLELELIPVFVVEAGTLQERAQSFVAHNKNRVAMVPQDVYRAQVAAGDEIAVATDEVCRRAGVRLKLINTQTPVNVGDCASFQKVQNLVRRHGSVVARSILTALVQARRAPISAAELDAAEAIYVMLNPRPTVDELARVAEAVGDAGLARVRMRAQVDGRPQKHVLFHEYLDILGRQTGVSRAVKG